jgi:hypothetical protein
MAAEAFQALAFRGPPALDVVTEGIRLVLGIGIIRGDDWRWNGMLRGK